MGTSDFHWCVPSRSKRSSILEIGYGREAHYPQFAALHTDSSYLRLTVGAEGTWGTSVVLLPVVWKAGHASPIQGAPIEITSHREEAETLVLDFTGGIAGLVVTGHLRFFPPTDHQIKVEVAVSVAGQTPLNTEHALEAFKTVMLSSMHVAPDIWDAERAFVDSQMLDIPAFDRWIVPPSLCCHTFGLQGGRSRWQHGKVAPTIVLSSSEILPVAGWISSPGKGRAGGPNSDHVALWAAYDQIQTAWRYTITAQVDP